MGTCLTSAHRVAFIAVALTLSSITRAQPSDVPFTIADDLPVGVRAEHDADDTLTVSWPIGPNGERANISFALRKRDPLIRTIGLAGNPILDNLDPAGVLTVGTRDLKPAGWTIFFDNPRQHPYETFPLVIARDAIQVINDHGRACIVVEGASAGPFKGELRITPYPGSRLMRIAMAMSTDRPATAYLFDAGLTSSTTIDHAARWKLIDYVDLNDAMVHADPNANAASPQVRARTIMAEGNAGGTVALVPPPHQYFYPLDYANNYATVWFGKDYRALKDTVGFGVRQTIEGDKRWVPWVNAPPGSMQNMGVFYLIDDGDAAHAMTNLLAFTHGDAFKPLPGFKTFSSHYHVEHTVDLLNQQKKTNSTTIPAELIEPQFVKRFKMMGVNIVHLAEFHLGENDLKIADRLTRLQTLHAECARLSTDQFLMLPGEEPNVHLGGHWLSFFPKPVYWTLDRAKGQPFLEHDSKLGDVYHVGSDEDVLTLMRIEHGLMWTAHPRIKASTGFPDVYKGSKYFKSDRFLGGAWKAMPADYSLPRLGTRVLDLLDDMNNWATNPSEHKQAPGEVDIFAIDAKSELYAHMNVNYLRLNTLPKFADGWQPVLDALRRGAFFTTTGEVLIPSFTLDGKQSGETLTKLAAPSTLRVTLAWTFPLTFAEVVSGDGTKVYRQRIDLSDTQSFGTRELTVPVDLRGRTWARFEVWDVATDGAYTQPVWIE